MTSNRSEHSEPESRRYEPEELDWLFRHECPLCGDDAAWTGEKSKVVGQVALVMACPHCGNSFDWASGRMQNRLKASPPNFMPGRGVE